MSVAIPPGVLRGVYGRCLVLSRRGSGGLLLPILVQVRADATIMVIRFAGIGDR
jgi:hypothetical protein